MTIESPHIPEPTLATRNSIEATIRVLVAKKENPYAIISGEQDDFYMQTLLTPEAFVIEYQEGSLDAHFETTRYDLSADEVIETFCDYAEGNETWKARFEFEKMKYRRSVFHLVGYSFGKLFGKMAIFFGVK